MSRIQIKSRSELTALLARANRSPVVVAKIAKRAAERMTELAATSFDARANVYGDPWELGRRGDEIVLNRTGKLRALALRYLAAGRRVSVNLGSLKYARFLLGRFWFLPKRGQVPSEWNREIRSIAGEELEAHFKGRAS